MKPPNFSDHGNSDEFRSLTELIALEFRDMLVKWGAHTPPRTGLHASSLLVSDKEWCSRRHVLSDIFPDDAVERFATPWDWKRAAIFENGWDIHRRWQRIFLKYGNVVYSDDGPTFPRTPELDLTHFDPERNLFFSPDAILDFGPNRYVVEIKGIKQESFKEIMITGDLETAMDLCETVDKAFFQCQLYMHLMDISRGIILVENKNNQDFHVWVIQYRFDAVKTAIERVYAVKRDLVLYHQKAKLPARVAACQSKQDTLARSCPMRDTCFSSLEEV